MQDNQLLEQLKNGNDKVLETIYLEYRDQFFNWIIPSYKCTLEDAKDHYQFAVLKLYENALNGRLNEMTSSIKTYLFAIGKNKVLESQKKAHKIDGNIDSIELYDEPIEPEKELKYQTIERCMDQLGEPCNELLKQYYYHKKSMDQIAIHFEYSNRDTAKNLKFKCLQRLRKLVQEEYKRVA